MVLSQNNPSQSILQMGRETVPYFDTYHMIVMLCSLNFKKNWTWNPHKTQCGSILRQPTKLAITHKQLVFKRVLHVSFFDYYFTIN